MASSMFVWKTLGSNVCRKLIFAPRSATPMLKKPLTFSQILDNVRTKLIPVARVSYIFSLANLSKDKLLDSPGPEKLSHEYLLTQASNSATTTSQQLLILTVAAIVDVAAQYRHSMEQLICLMDNTLDMSPNCPQESLWDQVVAMRLKVEQMKKRLRDLSSFMEYVDKLAMGTAEVSYFAGSESISTSMCNLINSAHATIKGEYEKTKNMECEFLRAQKEFIDKACEIEKNLKKRECELKQKSKAYYLDQLPKEGECRA